MTKPLIFEYKESCLISDAELQTVDQELNQEIGHILNARNHRYNTPYAAINLPFDDATLDSVKTVVKEKKALHPTVMIVIGIGGSNLGTVAIHEAIQGKLYNEKNPEMKVYFIDTVDADYIEEIIIFVKKEIDSGHNILINVISKSGTTTETIANFEIFLDLLKNYRPYNYHQFVVVTTDQDSALWNFAKEYKMACFAIPKEVGGRYSVFSAVSLFPLYFLGIDIQELHEGARCAVEIGTTRDIFKNPAALSAALLALHYKKKVTIHDTFLFSLELESCGKWYRQLMAESIGKAYNRKKELVNVGITPTVSVGSIDLHSVAQLYLGGPYDKFTTFISTAENNVDLIVEECNGCEQLGAEIQNKSLATIMNAILQGTKRAYLNDERPFVSITIPEKSAFYIGQLLQMKMLEIIYLGYLLNINPFDQPEVELYKKETRRILSTR